jgi:hypothetical protein
MDKPEQDFSSYNKQILYRKYYNEKNPNLSLNLIESLQKSESEKTLL